MFSGHHLDSVVQLVSLASLDTIHSVMYQNVIIKNDNTALTWIKNIFGFPARLGHLSAVKCDHSLDKSRVLIGQHYVLIGYLSGL